MTSAEAIEVLVVDDEEPAVEAITLILQAEDGIEVVGTAAHGEAAVSEARRLGPDVAVLDLRLPGLDGIEATRRIVAAPGNRTAVLALTTFATDELAIACIQAGAVGFCAKADAGVLLPAAVRTAAAGASIVSPTVVHSLLARLMPPRSASELDCSARELDVLELVGRGLTNAEIAARLVIGEATVRTHVQHLRTKLNARSRADLVVAAYESGLRLGFRR